jgi:outer membrane immunogenic protein
MRKILLATLALTALAAAPAVAADMAVRKAPPPPPIPVFSWTGCYIGGHGGGLWVSKDWHLKDHLVDHPVVDPLFFNGPHGSHDVDGFLFGIQGGCDYQFGGPGGGFVIGIAADYAWADSDGDHVHRLAWWDGGVDARFHSEVESVASMTARLGWAVDRFLIYVKGGVAWERDKFHLRTLDLFDEWHASDTRTGVVLGFGGEFAFTNFLSAFVEANWYNFDEEEVRFHHRLVCEGCDPFHHNWRIDEEKFVVKGGLNLRFGGWGGPAPVRARY